MKTLEELVQGNRDKGYHLWFKSIAEVLMGNYVIIAGQNTYRITECEFYYYCEGHPDETTYGYAKNFNTMPAGRIKRHKAAQRKTLTWFFHYSGIDIVIGNDKEPGGILIREIVNTSTGEKMTGPLVVLLELLNQGVSVYGGMPHSLELVYVDNSLPKDVKTKTRKGITSGNFEDKEYNFKAID